MGVGKCDVGIIEGVADVSNCESVCDRIEECKSFLHGVEEKKCWLKDKDQNNQVEVVTTKSAGKFVTYFKEEIPEEECVEQKKSLVQEPETGPGGMKILSSKTLAPKPTKIAVDAHRRRRVLQRTGNMVIR